jgi:hypothetical protein
MPQAKVARKPVKMRVLKLDPHRINDQELLNKWDAIWSRVYELRLALSRSRHSGQVISTSMMEEYEQARNTERQFFWDNFYEQNETSE